MSEQPNRTIARQIIDLVNTALEDETFSPGCGLEDSILQIIDSTREQALTEAAELCARNAILQSYPVPADCHTKDSLAIYYLRDSAKGKR